MYGNLIIKKIGSLFNCLRTVYTKYITLPIDRVNKQYIIYDGYLDHYIFVNLKFDKDEKQYNDFIGRVKVIDNYDNLPIRYRRLIESDNWENL